MERDVVGVSPKTGLGVTVGEPGSIEKEGRGELVKVWSRETVERNGGDGVLLVDGEIEGSVGVPVRRRDREGEGEAVFRKGVGVSKNSTVLVTREDDEWEVEGEMDGSLEGEVVYVSPSLPVSVPSPFRGEPVTELLPPATFNGVQVGKPPVRVEVRLVLELVEGEWEREGVKDEEKEELAVGKFDLDTAGDRVKEEEELPPTTKWVVMVPPPGAEGVNESEADGDVDGEGTWGVRVERGERESLGENDGEWEGEMVERGAEGVPACSPAPTAKEKETEGDLETDGDKEGWRGVSEGNSGVEDGERVRNKLEEA